MTIPSFSSWVRDNPREAARLKAYVHALAAKTAPVIQQPATQLGRRFAEFSEYAFPQQSPPPPVTAPSVFHGLGCLTAHDPLSLVRNGVVDRFAWVALKMDGGDHATLDTFMHYPFGPRRLGWMSWNEPLYMLSPTIFDGVILQAETPGELVKCLEFKDRYPTVPRALLTNGYMDAIPQDLADFVFAESYWNVQESQSPGSSCQNVKNRGAQAWSPLYGVGSDGGPWSDAYRVVPLTDYEHAWQGPDRAVYLGEYLTQADLAYLRSLPAR